VLDALTQDPAERKRALAVQADVEERLVACGGVTGQGIESHWLAFASAGEAKPPERPKLGNTVYRFTKRCKPVEHPVVEAPFWFSDTPADHRSRYVDDASLDGFRSRFHQLLYGEVETTDRMGKMLAEFPESCRGRCGSNSPTRCGMRRATSRSSPRSSKTNSAPIWDSGRGRSCGGGCRTRTIPSRG